MERNVNKYYPGTAETPKGHMNQSWKNVRSTKPKQEPFEIFMSKQMQGKKTQDVILNVYDVRETVFTDQTDQFPHHSRSGYKYIMVMVKINTISAICVAPIKIV